MKQRLKKLKISLGRLLCFQPRTRSGAGSLDNQERDNYEEGGKLKKEFLHTTRPLRIFFGRNRDFISLWWNVFNILSKNLSDRHKSWSFLVILIHISLTWRFFCICMLTKNTKYKSLEIDDQRGTEPSIHISKGLFVRLIMVWESWTFVAKRASLSQLDRDSALR